MKKTVLIMALAALALLLCACGGAPKEIDAQALAQELAALPFEDELSPAPEGTAEHVYKIEGAEESYIYIGSGATAEEVAVFSFADEAGAKAALEALQTRVEAQKAAFESYVPAELQRLDNALLRQSGNCAVLCVAAGDQAEEIVSKYLG